MVQTDKLQPAINVNIDPKEIYKIICPECRVKVREMTRALIEQQLVSGLVEEMTNQALAQVLPEPSDQPPPLRTLRSKRELKAER